MNTEDLTPEQLRELADEKEQDLFSAKDMKAHLREDVYLLNCSDYVLSEIFNHSRILSKAEIENYIEQFKKDIFESTMVPKGTICMRYKLDKTWDSDCGEISEESDDAIGDYLEGHDRC